MNYKLPRQIGNPELYGVVAREVRRQKISLKRASAHQLKEMAGIVRAISRGGMPRHLVRRKLPDGLGYGIFLHPEACPIGKGDIIAPYAGEMYFTPQRDAEDSAYAFEPLSQILFSREEQVRFDCSRCYHPRRLYSLYVDAQKKGNFTRFINHSETPNLVAELFQIPVNVYDLDPAPIEVIYRAQKTIRPGEQLLVCYEGEGDRSYWGALKVKPVPITPQTFQLDGSLKVRRSLF